MMVIHKHRFVLKSIKRQTQLSVMLPKKYDKDKKYPLLIMHDGQNLFFDDEAAFGVSWGLRDIYNKTDLNDRIVVGIAQASGLARLDEYNPFLSDMPISLGETPRMTGGKGDSYIHDIIDGVIPFMDSHYRVDLADITIGGSSMGGLISLYATLTYPDVFKNAICLSSAFWISETDILKYIKKTRKKHKGKIYMDTGNKEDKNDFTYLKSNNLVYQALKDKAYNVTFEVIENGTHHESSWGARIESIIKNIEND